MRRHLSFFFVILALLATGCSAPTSEGDRQISPRARAEYWERVREDHAEKYRKMNHEVVFHGLVLDLEGEPVPGAAITLLRSFIPPFWRSRNQDLLHTVSGPDGTFALEVTGYLLSLEELSREGYEFRRQYNPKPIFHLEEGGTRTGVGDSPDNPAIFRLRKRGTPTLILIHPFILPLRPGQVRLIDLSRGDVVAPSYLEGRMISFPDWQPDLRVSAAGEGEQLRLVIEPVSDGTGLVRDDRELFEAPAKGYRPATMVFPVSRQKGVTTFLYVEGRGGMFYAKLKVTAGVLGRDDRREVNLEMTEWLNPNGERNLEFSPELNRQYRKEKYNFR